MLSVHNDSRHPVPLGVVELGCVEFLRTIRPHACAYACLLEPAILNSGMLAQGAGLLNHSVRSGRKLRTPVRVGGATSSPKR